MAPTHSTTQRYLTISLVCLALTFLLEVFTRRCLCADGVFFFQNILEWQWFMIGDYARQFSHYLTQWPVVLAIRAFNVQDMGVLSIVYGASLYAVPLVTLALCGWLVPRSAAFYLLFPTFAFVYFAINSSLYVISESHVAVGCFWVVLFYLLFTVPNRPSRLQTLVATLTAFASVRTYEFYFFLGPLLSALALWRSRQEVARSQRDVRLSLYGIALMGLVSAGVGFFYLFFNPNRSIFTVDQGAIKALAFDPTAFLSSMLLGLFVLSTFWKPGSGRWLASRGAMASAVLIGAALGLLPLSERFLWSGLHQGARALNLIVPFGLAIVMVMHLRLRPAVASASGSRPAWATLLVCMLAWNATWQVVVSRRWVDHLDQFARVLSHGEGLVNVQDTPLEGSHFVWGWTLPSMSIILSGFGTGDVHSIVHAPREWHPFHPDMESEQPKLGHYGITYRLSGSHAAVDGAGISRTEN